MQNQKYKSPKSESWFSLDDEFKLQEVPPSTMVTLLFRVQLDNWVGEWSAGKTWLTLKEMKAFSTLVWLGSLLHRIMDNISYKHLHSCTHIATQWIDTQQYFAVSVSQYIWLHIQWHSTDSRVAWGCNTACWMKKLLWTLINMQQQKTI